MAGVRSHEELGPRWAKVRCALGHWPSGPQEPGAGLWNAEGPCKRYVKEAYHEQFAQISSIFIHFLATFRMNHLTPTFHDFSSWGPVLGTCQPLEDCQEARSLQRGPSRYLRTALGASQRVPGWR